MGQSDKQKHSFRKNLLFTSMYRKGARSAYTNVVTFGEKTGSGRGVKNELIQVTLCTSMLLESFFFFS